MVRTFRRAGKGRVAVWWMTHGRRTVLALQLVAVTAAFMAVSTWDYQDQLAQERYAKQDVQRILAEERRARDLPPTVWLIEAKTPEAAQVRLAQIAGQLDLERARMKGLVPR